MSNGKQRMAFSLSRELATAWANLRNGGRLLRFDRLAISRFKGSTHQVIVLVVLSLVSHSLIELAGSLPSPRFNAWGFATETTTFCVVLLLGIMVSNWSGRGGVLPRFLVAIYSVLVIFAVLSLVPRWSSRLPEPWVIFTLGWGYTLWFFGTLLFVLFQFSGRHPARTASLAAVVAVGFALVFSLRAPMWYLAPDHSESGRPRLNEERVFNSQFELLQDAQRGLKAARPGVTELYFLGFAGYGGQDVFRREVQYIRDLFDVRFGTRGRSVAMINHRDTVSVVPLATGSNLKRMLKSMARKMRTDRDVLFMYFTSHGSESHQLAVTLWPLGLNDVSPQDLKSALDEAGIRWRVLIVSACYSGGFIEPFRDDRTLVVTAAAADRQSFGCANERDFTYFGEAVFRNQLSKRREFIASMRDAIEDVRRRERTEALEPSNPQIHVGRLIPAKLRQIERRLFGQ